MAGEGKGIERELGEIRGCLDGLKGGIENFRHNEENIFERLGNLEKENAANKQRMRNLEDNFKKAEDERRREKDLELQRTNIKIAVASVIVAVVGILVGIALRLWLI